MRGIVYVAYGAKAMTAVRASIASLRRWTSLPIRVVSDTEISCGDTLRFPDPGYGARWAKLNIDLLVPEEWRQVLYLDADTLARSSPLWLFHALGTGWDMVLSFSAFQETQAFQHVAQPERSAMLFSRAWPTQFQCGMVAWRREECADFFACWREEWEVYAQEDQAAFVRALERCPVRVWPLTTIWNGHDGQVIDHRFGTAASLELLQ